MNPSNTLLEPLRRSELDNVFRSAEKPATEFRIGAESEKFGVARSDGRPLNYAGDFGVCQIFSDLAERHGWAPYREKTDGPILALTREGASVTLEPSMQFELSGTAYADLFEVQREFLAHFDELAPIAEKMGLVWLMTGFHPLARREELPWVPKQRYPIMREYLPTKGKGALDMMQRTATVQANYDYSSEADAMRKLRAGLALSPILHALFLNSPFEEGRKSEYLSRRGLVWLNMDPSRSGLVAPVWKEDARYDDYIEWALDAGMFLFRRGDEFVKNTGQTFRDFLANGFDGHFATAEDWKLHLGTLFPEVRLKNTLEMRALDSLPPRFALAAIALFTGLLYDETALDAALALLAPLTPAELVTKRPELVRVGLRTSVGGRSGFEFAERLTELARDGLVRRGRGEEFLLAPAFELLEKRETPAERALARVANGATLIEATALGAD